MFAPLMHPAMRHVGPVRRELGIPTVMNIVGPLANPARAGRQVVGVADIERAPILAGALAALGTIHAMVVYGEPGLDEVSPLGPTHVVEVRKGLTTRWTIQPEEHGFKKIPRDDLAGSEPAENARIIVTLLDGEGTVWRARGNTPECCRCDLCEWEGKDLCRWRRGRQKSIDSGQAKSVLERLRRASPKTVKTAT